MVLTALCPRQHAHLLRFPASRRAYCKPRQGRAPVVSLGPGDYDRRQEYRRCRRWEARVRPDGRRAGGVRWHGEGALQESFSEPTSGAFDGQEVGRGLAGRRVQRERMRG